MAAGALCPACLHLLDSHAPEQSAACSLLPPLSVAAVQALGQDQVLMCILSTLPASLVFYGRPLAEIASVWLAAGQRPNWITGGTLLGLHINGVRAVVLQLVDNAPSRMGVEAGVFAQMAVDWVGSVRSLLEGGGSPFHAPASRQLPGAASRPSFTGGSGAPGLTLQTPTERQLGWARSGCGGEGEEPATSLMGKRKSWFVSPPPPAGGAVAVASSGHSAAYTNAGRTFSDLDVRGVFEALAAELPPLTLNALAALPGLDVPSSVRSALSARCKGTAQGPLADSSVPEGVIDAARQRLLLPAGSDGAQVCSWRAQRESSLLTTYWSETTLTS